MVMNGKWLTSFYLQKQVKKLAQIPIRHWKSAPMSEKKNIIVEEENLRCLAFKRNLYQELISGALNNDILVHNVLVALL